jgi:hypothetical protein
MPKTIETEIEIDAPPSVVWDVLMKPSEWETWNTIFMPKNNEFVVDEPFEFHMNMSTDPASKASVFTPRCMTRDDTEYLLEWRGSFTSEWIFVGEHSWKLESIESGTKTKLVHCEDMKGCAMPLLKMAGQGQELVTAFVRVNEALKAKVENSKN